jgi:LysR family cys regulon transcriptional activator
MTIIKSKEILEKYNDLLDNLESLSQEKTHPLTGSLTLYHSHHSAMEVIPRALKLFRTKFPEVKFSMMEYAPIEAISKIREDPSIVGITNFPEVYYNDKEKISQYINPDLCSCEICHADLHVCIPKSWPLAKKKDITRNELGKQLMVYYDTLQYEDIVSIIFKGNKEMPVPFLKTLNNDLYRQAILDGLAFGLVSTLEYHNQRLLKEHTVLTSIRIPLVYNWVSSANFPTSVEAQEFLKCLKFSLENN